MEETWRITVLGSVGGRGVQAGVGDENMNQKLDSITHVITWLMQNLNICSFLNLSSLYAL